MNPDGPVVDGLVVVVSAARTEVATNSNPPAIKLMEGNFKLMEGNFMRSSFC
jgi:hypothetical protein